MQNIIAYFQTVRGLNRNAQLFLVHTVFSGLSIALLGLLYNFYVLSLDFKQDMIGMLTLVACAIAVVAALPVSVLLNRLGYKRALLLGVSVTTFSMLLPLWIPSGAALVVSEALWGIAYTLLLIAGAPFMTENSSDAQRTFLFSIQFVLTMFTAFVGYVVGGALPRWIGEWIGVGAESPVAYQGALYLSAGLMILSAVPFLFIRAKEGEKHLAHVAPRYRVRKPLPIAKLLAPYIVGALSAGMFVPFANVLWRTTQHVSDETIGNIFALSAILMVGAGIVSPMVTRRLGAARAMVLYQSVAVGGLLAFGFVPLFSVALFGYLVRDVLMNLVRPIYGQFMMDHSEPAERAAVSALATMGFNLAWGVSSWVSGEWQSANQFVWVIAASAALSIVAIGLMQYFFGQTEPHRQAQRITRPVGSPAE
jgi:MFS family permease